MQVKKQAFAIIYFSIAFASIAVCIRLNVKDHSYESNIPFQFRILPESFHVSRKEPLLMSPEPIHLCLPSISTSFPPLV